MKNNRLELKLSLCRLSSRTSKLKANFGDLLIKRVNRKGWIAKMKKINNPNGTETSV